MRPDIGPLILSRGAEMTENRTREGNGHTFELKLSLPYQSVITIRREAGYEEHILIPFLNEEGVPSMTGRPPSMADLEELVDLYIRYESAVFKFCRANELDALGLRFGIEHLTEASPFKAFRVFSQAEEAGVLGPFLQHIHEERNRDSRPQ
jgi:hypothetical protein